MRILIAGPDTESAYVPLVRAGYRVIGAASRLSGLRVFLQREKVEGLVVRDHPQMDLEDLQALVEEMSAPAVILLAPDRDASHLTGWIDVLPETTSWVEAAQALKEKAAHSQADDAPSQRSLPTRVSPPDFARVAAPSTVSPRPVRPHPPSSRDAQTPQHAAREQIYLYAVRGGVGATSLALTLAAAVAEVEVTALAVINDPLALAARTNLPLLQEGQVQYLDENLAVAVGLPGWSPPATCTCVVWDLPRTIDPAALKGGQVVILTRFSGEGRLATLRAINDLACVGVAADLVAGQSDGTLSAEDFARLCAGNPDFPPVLGYPADQEVAIVEEIEATALNTTTYGPAVRVLARHLLPGLPWQREEEQSERLGERKEGARSTGSSRAGMRRWFRVELTD
jgi:hypothetical protein